ncbi:MAG: rod shape-determining protein MreC [Alistipes sp.]|nr:rod shape-determining protein MreC [Alistipes sp.]
MYKLIEFLRRIFVPLLFVVFEVCAVVYYARSSDYTQARLLTRSNQAVGAVHGVLAGVRRYFSLAGENRLLLGRVATLEEELARYRRMTADSLHEALLADIGPKPYELSVARVISNSINKSRNYLVLDRGLRDGVEEGMGVLSPEGAMVGRVVACSERYAVALSILNTAFKASGKIAGDDYFGSIYWTGDDRYRVRMRELSKYARIEEGDEVVSSGFSQYFPADIPIGFVESFSLSADRMSYDVEIRLAVNVSQLTDVILIRNRDLGEIRDLEFKARTMKN